MIRKITLLLLIICFWPNLSRASLLEQKIDSLFVIASSGELRYRDMVEPAIEEIAQIGASAVPHLIDKFTTKSARERLTIVNILKKIGAPAVPDLVKALNRSEGLIVQRVCWALGDICDSSALGPLVAVSNHSRWQVRDQAIGALGKIGVNQSKTTVITALSDSVGQVRKAAAVAVGKLSANEAVPQLVHMLGDDFYGARMSAVNSLLSLDSQIVFEQLADSVHTADEMTGNLICYILGELAVLSALDLLLEQYLNGDSNRRAHAGVALIKADPDNYCHFQAVYLVHETDRLTRLKIESALAGKNDAE